MASGSARGATAHAADSAADCLRADNVWVVVQDNDKTPQGGCATSFSTGYDAMVSAGFDVNGEGFVCQIDGAPVPDATTSTFTLPSVTEDDDGLKVRLVATNSAGTVTTTPVTLTVRPFSGVADIPDEKFRECLNESLSQSATASITTDQLGTLTDVSCFFKGVTDLTGAEHLTSLTSFDLTFNKVTDVAPLANLGTLTTLNLDSNQVADITPLAGGTALTSLDLDKNGLTSLQGISSMTGLRSLSVGGNSLPTLPAMGSLNVLEMLDVSGNPLTSLDAAATLRALTTLLAYNTEIADTHWRREATQGSSSPGTNTPTPPRKSPDHPIGLPKTGN